jgi:hypothetical protein
MELPTLQFEPRPANSPHTKERGHLDGGGVGSGLTCAGPAGTVFWLLLDGIGSWFPLDEQSPSGFFNGKAARPTCFWDASTPGPLYRFDTPRASFFSFFLFSPRGPVRFALGAAFLRAVRFTFFRSSLSSILVVSATYNLFRCNLFRVSHKSARKSHGYALYVNRDFT